MDAITSCSDLCASQRICALSLRHCTNPPPQGLAAVRGAAASTSVSAPVADLGMQRLGLAAALLGTCEAFAEATNSKSPTQVRTLQHDQIAESFV
jgi:hypothetical protein